MTEPMAEPPPAADSPAAPAAAYPFSVLRVLATAMRVTKSNWLPFLVLASVLDVPSLILQGGRESGNMLLGFVLQSITASLTSAVVTYGVIMELHGSRPSARACTANGFSQLGAVLGVTFVSVVVIMGATLLLIVPGIIVMLMLYVVVPVVVVEKLGIEAAMKRSRDLTNGRKGDLFLIVMLGIGVGVAIQLVAGDLGSEAAFIFRATSSALTTLFFSVTAAVVYVELRNTREGTRIPELAAAFARIRK